jgi:hypothetical protein
MTLAEAKSLLENVQKGMAAAQAFAYLEEQRCCPDCRMPFPTKGHHEIVVRTVFGKLRLDSPRWYGCRRCTPTQARSSRSPLAALFAERATPELVYLETKFASLVSYGLAVDVLGELLPIGGELSATTVRRDQQRVAQRLEDELGGEEASAVTGCPREWAALPPPEAPLIVGLDGGYVRARDGAERKAGTFEVIVGKTFSEDRSPKSFAFVHGLDARRRRRVHESLVAQGMQLNQRVTFMSDGGDTVRDLQLYLTPEGEHILDWFHVTMKLTVMGQMLAGLKSTGAPESAPTLDQVATNLERLKHFLWHGNTVQALEVVDDLESSAHDLARERPEAKPLRKALREFETYVASMRRSSRTTATATGTASPSRPPSPSRRSTTSSASGSSRSSRCAGRGKALTCSCRHARACSTTSYARGSRTGTPGW